MKMTFVNGRLSIVVRYWEEHIGPIVDGGVRVELRRVSEVTGRKHRAGAAGFTVAPVSDGGLWRADLFAVLTEPGKHSFHFHPEPANDDVGKRMWDDDLRCDPQGWIAGQLGDLPALLRSCGAEDLLASVDLEEHRRALPVILMAVNTCLARLPSRITAYADAASSAPAVSV